MVTQHTTVSGSLIDGVLILNGTVDLNGVANALILDADGDTTISANTDNQIDYKIGGAIDFTMTSNLLNVLAGSAISGAGSTFVPLLPSAAQQALSGAGAINITSWYTAWTSTGADAGTLVDGAAKHQLKKIQLIVDGGDATLTPSNLNGGTTIVFADAGDFAILKWDGSNWDAIELGNAADGATSPTLS